MIPDEVRCQAKSKQTGERCKLKAVEGKRVCRFHGGYSTGRPIIHGRYSTKKRAELQAKIDEFKADPAAGDLRDELAVLRALLQDYLDRLTGDDPIPPETIGHIYNMVDAIGKLVERIAKILSLTALTQAELQLLQVTLIDAIKEFIPEPERQRAFVSRIGFSFGGGMGANQRSISGDAIEATDTR